MNIQDNEQPIEIWLRQPSADAAVTGQIVYFDESTDEVDMHSLSVRGAQREATGWLIRAGYEPDGAWQGETEDESEVSRWLRRGMSQAA